MSKVFFENTPLVQNICMEVSSRCGGFLQDKVAIASFKAMMCGVSEFLKTVKSPKTPMAFTITDTEGNFIAGAYVVYNESPDTTDEASGNWNYAWTFYKDDIPENATVYDIKSETTHKIITDAAFKYASAVYYGGEAIIDMFTICFSVLKDYLLEVATEDDVYEMEDPGVFEAQAKIENGEKVIALIPNGKLKSILKGENGDETIEKENSEKEK